jgi:steroid delta-isomerase
LPSPVVIRQAVAAYFAATRTMNLDAWLATFAPDALDYDPVGTPPVVGHQGLRQFFQTITGVFERLGITEDHVFVGGNGAAVKWTGRGVGKNGRDITFEGIDVFEIDDQGKIRKLWGYWDAAKVMEELLADD